MKVLIAHWRPDIVSGAEIAVADMVNNEAAQHDYLMLTPGKGALAEYYATRGLTVRTWRIQTPRRRYPGLHTVQSHWLSVQLKRHAVDIVVSNTFPAASRVGTGCRLAGLKHVVYVREYIRQSRENRRILDRVDAVCGVSHDVSRYLLELEPATEVLTLHDYVDLGELDKRLRSFQGLGEWRLPFSEEYPVVGFVGRITRYKQPDLFLRAARFVTEMVPKARFVVIGGAIARDQQYESELRGLARELGISGRVRFLGQRPDALELMSQLSACCVPSDREPFPRVVLEAQAVRCPVVASDTGGCPEMIDDGETGLLFPVKDPGAAELLAERVVRLLRNPQFSSRLTTAARLKLASTFASTGPVERFERVLRSIVTTGRGGEGVARKSEAAVPGGM